MTMEVPMQKKFMTLGMVLCFCLSLWTCPVWSAETSAIMTAIGENDVYALQAALKPGVRLDVTDSRGHTPLDVALTQGNAFSGPVMVHILLRHGVRPGSVPADPALTLVHLLVTQAPLEQLNVALQAAGKVDAAMPNGLTAFLWAAAFAQDPAVLDALVKAGADSRQILPGGDARLGDNALLMAAEHNGTPEIILFLLRQGLDVNSRSSMLGDSALMVACRANRNPAVAETLVRHDADVDMRNGVGCSAFLFAARRADGLGLLRLLAERGANVQVTDDSLSNALHAACAGQGSPEAIRFLLSAGLPVNGRTGKDFGAYSPLMLAVRNASPDAEVIRLLLQQGADTGLRDMDGNRAGDGLPAERISWLKRNGLAEIL